MFLPLSTRLEAAHHARFVGREAELRFFLQGLQPEARYNVLYIHGPGGVGKTSLLYEGRYLCRQEGVPVYYLDVRDVEATPEAFLDALCQMLPDGLALPDGTALPDFTALFGEERVVLMVDTAETLKPLEPWLCRAFLPRLPVNVLFVLAGRTLPSLAWRTDAGLQALVQRLPLRNLSPEESRRYLAVRHLPEQEWEDVLAFSHGHPLALSLVADAFDEQPDLKFEPVASPNIVGPLLERFLHEVTTPERRLALEACAMLRVLQESTLAALLDQGKVHGLFEWLRGLSFVDASARGLFLHDLVREVLVADLHWRDPERFATLHTRARQYYTRLLQDGVPGQYQLILADYLFLHRHHPVVRPLFLQLNLQWERSHWIQDHAEGADLPALLDMVCRHEGQPSAGLLEYWMAQQPEGLTIFRDEEGAPSGFTFDLALERTTPADRRRDPAVAAAWSYLEDYAPLRGEERATMFRFWMDREAYQGVSPAQSLFFVHTIRHYLVTPKLAFTFLPCARPEFWQMIFAFAGLERLPEADFKAGTQAFGVFGHDWRVEPPAVWLERIAEQGLLVPARAQEEPAPAPQLIVLSRPDFEKAVKQALKSFTQPTALHDNPLLRSRMVLDEETSNGEVGSRAEALRTLLREAAETLKPSQRTKRYYWALQHTYLVPEPTQEQAAALLDLPFSTFRRHLKNGLDYVTDHLWEREVGA